MASSIGNVSYPFVRGYANSVANAIARVSSSMSGPYIWTISVLEFLLPSLTFDYL